MFGSRSLTVAIVDDDEAVRDALRNLLASLDLGVATFASAEDFLASPACRAAACLITDVQMPGMSGLDLQRHLAGAGNLIPVILITAFPHDHLRQQAEAEGAYGFFAKPFDGGLMIDCIERALVGKGAPA
ncbi:MAG: response regulator [Rhodospirillales bacterium]|nr:response regulator [Rhodospirillales bacterium]